MTIIRDLIQSKYGDVSGLLIEIEWQDKYYIFTGQ